MGLRQFKFQICRG